MSEKTNKKAGINFSVGDALWGNIFKKDVGQKNTTIALLRNVPLFRKMRKSELNELEKIIHHRTYKTDEKVFFEGEPGVGMYVIQEGNVGIDKTEPDGKLKRLASLSKGEFFGELALLDESPRSATATALEDTQILGLFRPDLLELIERKPRLGNKLLFELAYLIGERLKHTNEELQKVWEKLDEEKVIK